MFFEERVTQMAAYLLMKNDRKMAHIKLLKLLYLAERNAMAKWGCSMSGDKFISMPHGPELSQTYDLISNHYNTSSLWQQWLLNEEDYEIALNESVSLDTLDELSRSELKILDDVFTEFGRMDKFEIVDYTHNNCSEWIESNGSSLLIKPESILRAIGKSNEQITQLIIKHKDDSQLDMVKAMLKVQ